MSAPWPDCSSRPLLTRAVLCGRCVAAEPRSTWPTSRSSILLSQHRSLLLHRPPHLHLVGWAVWGGVPQRRCALLLLSRSRFLSCGPFVFLTYLIFPRFAPTDAPTASQGPLPLNADPSSMAARRASPLARKIYYFKLLDEVEREPSLWHMGPCASCGQATGNYCDTCVTAGRSFEVPSGLVMSGSPLCSSCEDEFHCYVCVGVVPPGIAGPPTVPLVTLAAIPPAPTA